MIIGHGEVSSEFDLCMVTIQVVLVKSMPLDFFILNTIMSNMKNKPTKTIMEIFESADDLSFKEILRVLGVVIILFLYFLFWYGLSKII